MRTILTIPVYTWVLKLLPLKYLILLIPPFLLPKIRKLKIFSNFSEFEPLFLSLPSLQRQPMPWMLSLPLFWHQMHFSYPLSWHPAEIKLLMRNSAKKVTFAVFTGAFVNFVADKLTVSLSTLSLFGSGAAGLLSAATSRLAGASIWASCFISEFSKFPKKSSSFFALTCSGSAACAPIWSCPAYRLTASSAWNDRK